jgi:GR25 family glycosyltransferase involved in LPS biosynthesis
MGLGVPGTGYQEKRMVPASLHAKPLPPTPYYHVQDAANPLRNIVSFDQFLDPGRCADIIAMAEKTNRWTTDRHTNYPTTDIPLGDIQGLAVSTGTDLVGRVVASLRECYELGDDCLLDPHDIFVVKYSAQGQTGLEAHRDNSELSFVLLLSDPQDFEGGGTYYEETGILVNPRKRGSLVIHCGKTRHTGRSITSGTRYILIGFVHARSRKLLNLSARDTARMNTMSLPDKRYHDYLWVSGPYQPLVLHVSVINLRTRGEKRRAILERLNQLPVPENMRVEIRVKEANPGDYGVPFENWSRLRSQAPKDQKAFYSREITKGEIGCFNSHRETLREFDPVDQQGSFLLVLEDDADFNQDFLYRVHQSVQELGGTPLWDAIDFGGKSIDQKSDTRITDSLVEKGALFQAHAILYSCRGAKKINDLDPTVVLPWDDFLTAVRKEHPVEELNRVYDMERFVMYNSYVALSWQVANGIHDTENGGDATERCSIVSTRPPTKIEDDFDMINYYRYADIELGVNAIASLFAAANSRMWHFHLDTAEGSFAPRSIHEWQLAVTPTRKLVGVVPLEEDSVLELHQHTARRIVHPAKHSIYIFPAYLLFKCTHCAVFYAVGDPLT